MTDKPKRQRRKRCDECGALFPPDQLAPYMCDFYDDETETAFEASIGDFCPDCTEAMNDEADEPPYGVYGDREDQIPFDSAMFRD